MEEEEEEEEEEEDIVKAGVDKRSCLIELYLVVSCISSRPTKTSKVATGIERLTPTPILISSADQGRIYEFFEGGGGGFWTEILQGGGGGLGSSKMKVRGNFHSDPGRVLKPRTPPPPDPPLELHN